MFRGLGVEGFRGLGRLRGLGFRSLGLVWFRKAPYGLGWPFKASEKC